MQRLNEKWLKLINLYLISTASVYLLIYGFFAFQQESFVVVGKESFGISVPSVILVLVFITYNILIFRRINRSNVWLSYLISTAIYAIASSMVVEVSLETVGSFVFLFNNALVLMTTPAYGYLPTLFGVLIASIVYITTTNGSTRPTSLGVVGDGISVVLRVVVTLYILYKVRNHYEIEGIDSDNYIERYFVKNEVVRLLTDSMDDGVLILDKNGVIKSVNLGTETILGKEFEQLIGRKIYDVMDLASLSNVPLDKEQNPVFLTLKSHQSTNAELILILDNEDEIFIDMTVSTIVNRTNNDFYGMAVIIRDVSARRKQEQDKIEFISTASHEMRTPLAAIEGFLALALLPDTGLKDQKLINYLNKAYDNTQHLSRLFRDLLISTNAENGEIANNPSVVNLEDLLGEVIDSHQTQAQEKGFELNLIVSDHIDGRPTKYLSRVDPDRIREVISNIIENAMKYSDGGSIDIRLTGDDSLVQFSIADTGQGMTQSNMKYIFDKFYRVDGYLERSTNGTGLGLFICKKIIELYDGQIWAESKKNVGSTFYVNLPRYFEVE